MKQRKLVHVDGQAIGQQIMVEAAQRAVGVLAARRRGDASGAQALMDSFPNDGARAFGFLLVSELTLVLLEKSTGEPAVQLCQDLSLNIAGSFSFGP